MQIDDHLHGAQRQTAALVEADLMQGLNDAQREASRALEGAVLVLAGAGSGKTQVLTTRLALLVLAGVEPSRILAVTFTNKAAGEMKERLTQLIGEERTSLMWIGTFHAISLRILKIYGDRIGFDDFSILNADDSMRVMKNLLKDMNIDPKVVSVKMILWHVDRWKNKGFSPQEVARCYLESPSLVFEEYHLKESNINPQLYVTLYQRYQQNLHDANAMDFGDLLLYCLELFHHAPDVLDRLSQKFYAISVDEYQDSNDAQRSWLLALGSAHGNVFCVGDEDQSIYGWRGASIENILAFPSDFVDTRVFRLEQNYRSSRNILRAASHLIAHNKKRYDKTLWSANENGKPITVTECMDGSDEALKIASMLETGGRKSQAVLVRAGHQTRVLEEAFMKKNIAYRIVGSVRFYERSEIRDALAYLRLVAKPGDRMAFERAASAPRRGIGPAALQKITDWAEETNQTFTACLQRCAEDQKEAKDRGISKAIIAFMEQVDVWRKLLESQIPLVTLLESILNESGYLEMLSNVNDPLSLTGRLENLKELKVALGNYVTLDAFLDQVSLLSSLTDDSESNLVSMMTIHAAKGLEFDEVFLPGWEMATFPSNRTIVEHGEAGLEEERRLAYVAITRAKEAVHLFYALERSIYGKFIPAVVSPFIGELPQEVCVFKRSSGAVRQKAMFKVQSGGVSYTRQKQENFGIGDRCIHKRFGVGVVEKSDNDLVYIKFDDPDIGEKVVLSRFLSPFNDFQ